MGYPPLIGRMEPNLKELQAIDDYNFANRCKCLSHLLYYGCPQYEWSTVSSRRYYWRNNLLLMRGLMCAERAEKMGVTEKEDIAAIFGRRPEGMTLADWATTEYWRPKMVKGRDVIPALPPPHYADGANWPDDDSNTVIDRSNPPRFLRMETVEETATRLRIKAEREADRLVNAERIRAEQNEIDVARRLKEDKENADRAARRRAERLANGEVDPIEELAKIEAANIAREKAEAEAEAARVAALPPPPKPVAGLVMTVPRKPFPK